MRFRALIIALVVGLSFMFTAPALSQEAGDPRFDPKESKAVNIRYAGPQLSNLSFICDGKLYFSVFSALTVADVRNLYNDFITSKSVGVLDAELFIDSPGGDAFSGLALADLIERARKMGFKVTGYATGIVASAAVPVLAVCTIRKAAPGTIFMVHETSIWKWPGRETHSDIRSQNELMDLLRNRYLGKLVKNSHLDREAWEALEHKTTWFDADKAKDMGIVDIIE